MALKFPELRSNAQRGSKPRCHLLTDGAPEVVAARLTALATPFATVSASDHWMPRGFADIAEAELDKAASFLSEAQRGQLAAWWLPAGHRGARTPNFDIVSTCAVNGRPALLLVEAKAHAQELEGEAAGRQLPKDATEERKASHPAIGQAIEEARAGLAGATGLPWGISRDSHYQMSNRFAWCWKLTTLGVPVVLVYLGFLDALEMADQGAPLATAREWEQLVLRHAEGLVPREAWGRSWAVDSVPFVALIASAQQPLERLGS